MGLKNHNGKLCRFVRGIVAGRGECQLAKEDSDCISKKTKKTDPPKKICGLVAVTEHFSASNENI